MRIGELRWVLRHSEVLGEAGGEPAPAELADALWLAALHRGGRPAPPAADVLPPAADFTGETANYDAADQSAPEYQPEPLPLPPVFQADPGPVPHEPRPDPQIYATLPVRGRPSPGVLVAAAAKPQLAEALSLAREMRPLRRLVRSTTRYVLDEEGTADLRAEQRLWLPALVPDNELAFDLALVVDDSESMALWGEKVREFRLLCQRVGAFRDVRLWRLGASGDGSQAKPVLRGLSRASWVRDERELIDPSGRRLILVITDGVHPWWRPSGPLQPVLARWALSSPLAILQPFPQRLWDRSPLRPVIDEFRSGWPGSGPTICRAGNKSAGDLVSPGSVVVPVLELSPAAMRRWAGIISGTAGPTPLPATVLSRESSLGEELPGSARDDSGESLGQADPAQLVREFRASASPAAYRLAGYLSAAPLTLRVMRLVQESMMSETGPTELAEVFLSGLLRRAAGSDQLVETESASYVFAAGVRDVLQSMLTRDEAHDVLCKVGSYLVRGRRGGRDFPVLLHGEPSGDDIQEAAEQFPATFGRVSGRLLERIRVPDADAVRELARPEEAVPGPLEDLEEETKPPAPTEVSQREGWKYDPTRLPNGKLYQPMLFLGLGGTGCDIGAEIERRLRDAICGLDGNSFRHKHHRENMLPYQLPTCVQFVYADMNLAELDRLPSRVVPRPEHESAARLSAHYMTGLASDVIGYPELAMRLRLRADDAVRSWLPPNSHDEPKVNPLHWGAGQYPTVGRASLFGTLVDGIAPAVREIREAIGKLAGSGADLSALNGESMRIRGIDVFVAFSVAGGTGAGIFYDYLHLIAEELRRSQIGGVKIYPLVLMPSAFPEGSGGGRLAQLNAGRALSDLFRLVDQQNSAASPVVLRGAHDPQQGESEEVAVRYPDGTRIVIERGTVQTGFVFSQPEGVARTDMDRSIASLVMSLVGTEMLDRDGDTWSDQLHQSFPQCFVNERTDRRVAADDGIGLRSVSTALVASLTVPVDELAGIVSSRLLRETIFQISTPVGMQESTRPDIEEFLIKSGTYQVALRPGVEYADPAPVNGAREIAAAVNRRRESMRVGIHALRTKLSQEVPQLVARFDPLHASRALLSQMDIFKLQRVVNGHQALRDEGEQGGVSGLLQRRRATPQLPPGYSREDPPGPPELRDRAFRRVQWGDESVVMVRQQQDNWYLWRTHVEWAYAWDRYSPQWNRPLEQVRRDVSGLTRALMDFALADDENLAARSAELYGTRVGVSYLVPTSRMEHFYNQVVRRLRERFVNDGALNPNSSESEILGALIGADCWPEAFKVSIEQDPETAVSFLLERAKVEVKNFLLSPSPAESQLLPRLRDMLTDCAGQPDDARGRISADHRSSFVAAIKGFIPANFVPPGSGPMKVLVSYPADASSAAIEQFLANSMNLPSRSTFTVDFRNGTADAITVLLFRTGMGITEVPEVRGTIRRWADAQAWPRPGDLLPWRQRTGYDFGYLATRETERVRILHGILCALWNGKATVIGPEASPESLNVTLGGGVAMTLPLTPLGAASSWSSLLHSYELWALDDSDLHRQFCAQLMRELPDGLSGRPRQPDRLYLVVRDLAEGQIEILDNMLETQEAIQRSRAALMRSFWAVTLPGALDQAFTMMEAPVAASLRVLELLADGYR